MRNPRRTELLPITKGILLAVFLIAAACAYFALEPSRDMSEPVKRFPPPMSCNYVRC